MAVQFFFIDVAVTLNERRRLKQFIKEIFIERKRSLIKLSVIFCSDDYLLTINKNFLQHDYYTDIITFNLSDNSLVIDGEIYISVDRVRENANINTVTITNELHRIIFHGVLHLCGFKDKSKTDRLLMTQKEDATLHRYFK
ncbi:MAG: rRNA maturation RNase YbeY [Ferruginibacter sp.]